MLANCALKTISNVFM